MNSIPTRDEIAEEYKWDLSTVFESPDEWSATLAETRKLAESLRERDPRDPGRLSQHPHRPRNPRSTGTTARPLRPTSMQRGHGGPRTRGATHRVPVGVGRRRPNEDGGSASAPVALSRASRRNGTRERRLRGVPALSRRRRTNGPPRSLARSRGSPHDAAPRHARGSVSSPRQPGLRTADRGRTGRGPRSGDSERNGRNSSHRRTGGSDAACTRRFAGS